MDEITQFWVFFGFGITILALLIYLQITFINKSKKKTDPKTNVFYFCVLFESFTPFLIIFVNWFSGIISIIAIIVAFLVKFYTEQWYRDHMRLKGEYNIRLKFLNHEAESEIVNVFKKRDTETKTIENTLRTNIEIIEKLTKTNFYADVIDIYLDIHPELTIEDLAAESEDLSEKENELLQEVKQLREENERLKNLKSSKGKKLKPKTESDDTSSISNTDFLKDKETSFRIFRKIFTDTYFHRIFFHFEFFELELDEEISCDIQALVISFHEELPHDLILTCGLLEPETVDGRTFTTIFALEGMLDEGIAKKINAKINDFEVFKAFPSFFKMDRLANRIEAQDIIIQEQNEEIRSIASKKLSVDAAMQRHVGRFQVTIPQTNHKKRRWSFGEDEEEGE